MANYKALFMSYMDHEHIRYTEENEYILRVVYKGNNLKTIPMFVRFDGDDAPHARIRCAEIANFSGKEDAGIRLCNTLNNEYRWLKFYLDENAELIAALDTYFDEQSCGFFCLDLVKRSVTIIDEVYPRIARTIWS